LIHAGASGVGTSAIQLAKLFDNKVIVTVGSDDKASFAKKMGADHAINYKKQDFEKEVDSITSGKGVNILIDCVGASHFSKNLSVMATDGRFILYGLLSGGNVDQLDLSSILYKRLQITGSALRSREELYKVVLCHEFFEFAQDFFTSGKLKPTIDKTFPLEDAKGAHEYMEADKTKGKVVLTVNH